MHQLCMFSLNQLGLCIECECDMYNFEDRFTLGHTNNWYMQNVIPCIHNTCHLVSIHIYTPITHTEWVRGEL